MSVIITKFSKDDITEMSGVMRVMNKEMNNIKSVDELIEQIEQAKQYKGLTGNSTIDKHNIELDRYFDLGLDKAIKIIKEYCEVEE